MWVFRHFDFCFQYEENYRSHATKLHDKSFRAYKNLQNGMRFQPTYELNSRYNKLQILVKKIPKNYKYNKVIIIKTSLESSYCRKTILFYFQYGGKRTYKVENFKSSFLDPLH